MNLSQSGNGAANLKEGGMSPFGSEYRWRTTVSTVSYYVLRRILGAVAGLLDGVERRERDRRARLRAHPSGTRGGQRARH